MDASVLINFLVIGRLDLLERLPEFRFVVAEEVVAEITRPRQRELLERSLSSGTMERTRLVSSRELALFSELRSRWGRGESACLAMAIERQCLVACDEAGGLLNVLRARLGENRIVNTPGLVLRAIHAGLLSISEADELKERLEGLRFRMAFSSFRDLVVPRRDPA